MNKSYSRGILLWIDDNNWESLTTNSGDIEVWRKIFGNTESKVYRLLGLQLEIAMTFEAAEKAIARYSKPEYASTFVTAIVDLRIPRKNGGVPDIKYGLKIAKVLNERGIPFVFLSNMSPAQDKLRNEGLESIPYYQKQSGVNEMFMPEELIRATLSAFRNHISWINLRSLEASVGEDRKGLSVMGGEKGSASGEIFPFFGVFRDFVERWENRPYPSWKDLSFVLRSPEDHCDEFVQQCALIVLSQYLHLRRDVSLTYISANDIKSYLTLGGKHTKGVCVFRLNSEVNTPSQLEELIKVRKSAVSIYVIPNDETAENFLDVLPRRKNVIYDDLPLIRKGDQALREDLIRKVAGYVFQEVRITMDDGETSLAPLFKKCPELLIHPLNWTALMENEYVDSRLSDPYEVFGYLAEATQNLVSFDPASKQKLIEGIPIEFNELLKVADAIVEGSVNLHFRWWQQMMDSWLRTSWHFPYGLADKVKSFEDGIPFDAWEKWEDFCLDVIVKSIFDEKAARNGGEIKLLQLIEVTSFFRNPAIKKLQNNEEIILSREWEDLASKRWPHLSYPLPIALGRKLKLAGRYSWIQNDHMDLATVFPVGQREFRHLNDLTAELGERIHWLSKVSESLPAGWRESTSYLVSLMKERNVRSEWDSNPVKLWDSLLTILRNATPISLIFHFAITNKPLSGMDKAIGSRKNSAEFELSSTDGYGKIHGMIRGNRKRAREILRYDIASREGVSESLEHFVSYGLLGKRYAEKYNELGIPHNLREIPNMLHDVFNLPLDNKSLEQQGEEVLKNIEDIIAESMSGKANNWFPFFGDKNRRENKKFIEQDWGKDLDGIGISSFTSQLATKADYMFHTLDMLNDARFISMGLRHYDGYPMIAILGDIRNKNKDSVPQVSVETIEELLEMFVWSAEGLIAQLKVCLLLAGDEKASEAIELNNIKIELPLDLLMPDADEVASVLKVVNDDEVGLEVFTLGIPGKNTANNYCFHMNGSTKSYKVSSETELLEKELNA